MPVRAVRETFDCQHRYFRVRSGDHYEECTFLNCAGIVIDDDAEGFVIRANHIRYARPFHAGHGPIALRSQVDEAWDSRLDRARRSVADGTYWAAWVDPDADAPGYIN